MNLIIIRLYFIYFWFLLFVSCVFIDTRARLHLVVWFNVFGQFQYYIVDGWNIFLIMRSALFSFTDLYIKTANYYFEESKNDWLNFIHLMPHIFIGRSNGIISVTRLLHTKISQIMYITWLILVLLGLIQHFFAMLFLEFNVKKFFSVNLSSSILVVKLIKIITVIMNQFSLTLYNFYVAPISIWVIKLIETIAVSLLCTI